MWCVCGFCGVCICCMGVLYVYLLHVCVGVWCVFVACVVCCVWCVYLVHGCVVWSLVAMGSLQLTG